MPEQHEPINELSSSARDIHRALESLKEEIEAIDWYHQRIVTTTDDALKEVLVHNRDEEMEHACMLIEWLRKNMPAFDRELSSQLFKKDVTRKKPIGT